MQPRIIQHSPQQWADSAAREVQNAVAQVLKERGQCSVMLTGGRAGERLYTAWAALPVFWRLKSVHFYFGDERCVPPAHEESNYGLAMRTLFRDGVPEDCVVRRIEAEAPDRDAAARRYAEELPARIDVLLLGVGEDGHIASLFPGSSALREANKVVPVRGPKSPVDRITITPPVIETADVVFVLATEAGKARPLVEAVTGVGSTDSLPVRLVTDGTWLLDFDLAQETT